METEKREKHSDITSFLIRSNNHFTKKTDRLVAHSSLVRNPTVSFQFTEIPLRSHYEYVESIVEFKSPNMEGFVYTYCSDMGEHIPTILMRHSSEEDYFEIRIKGLPWYWNSVQSLSFGPSGYMLLYLNDQFCSLQIETGKCEAIQTNQDGIESSQSPQNVTSCYLSPTGQGF